MRKSFLFFIALLVFLSGCVQNGGDIHKATSGLIIKEWAPIIIDSSQTFLPNQPIEFDLVLENIGSEEADSIKVETTSEFNLQPSCKLNTKLMASQEESCSFSGHVPDIPSGLKVEKQARISVIYKYTSVATEAIQVKSYEQARLARDSGAPLTFVEGVSPKNSPLSIDIQAKTPVTVFQNTFSSPILITVKNVGGGIVCSPDCKNGENKFSYQVELLEQGVKFSDTCQSTGVKSLKKDESYTLPCTIIESTQPQFDKYPIIRVTLNYEYKTEDEATIAIDTSGKI